MQRIGIAVAGGSCSGKTTLAHELAERMDATLVRIDDYYRPLDHLSYDERCEINFDHPDAIDSPRLIEDVQALLHGRTIDAPRYDFTRHTRFGETERVEPRRLIVVEGLFTLCYPELVDLCQIRVFVDASEDVCLDRRIHRDVNERGRTPGEVIGRFQSHVAPMYRAHVLPSARHATVRVCGISPIHEGGERVARAVPVLA